MRTISEVQKWLFNYEVTDADNNQISRWLNSVYGDDLVWKTISHISKATFQDLMNFVHSEQKEIGIREKLEFLKQTILEIEEMLGIEYKETSNTSIT